MVDLSTVVARGLSCESLATTFSTHGLVSINATTVSTGVSIPVPSNCVLPGFEPQSVAASLDLCHIALAIETSTSSRTHLDAWLPTSGWNGRLLGTGTGGLSGCVDFEGLGYGSSLGFATIGTDAGHSGPTAAAFLNAPDVLLDFFGRAMHTEAVVGKQLVKAFYGSAAARSYYMGCSQGGRQGFQAASDYPYDFDGVLAGDPALNVYNLVTWFGVASKPFLAGTPGALTPAQWEIVHDETFRQCDALDGKLDRTIAYPEECNFDVTPLLKKGLNTFQVNGLKKLYTDVYGPDGKLFFPRYSPGAENSGPIFNYTFTGAFPELSLEYFRYAVYSDPDWDPRGFSLSDGDLIKRAKFPGTAFFGDLRKFKERGGKILTYHGTQDTLITSALSELQYAQAALKTGDLKSFYAFYLVPGMDHCTNLGGTAKGPWRFGQMGNVPLPRAAANTSESNALLALVDWVENGHAPGTLVGLTDDGEKRELCRYPAQGHWHGDVWKCGS